MSYLALYREWRPKTFDEVVEQKQAVYALRQAVIKGQIAHAYLFSGTRGTGKTTLAKIFSRAINCLEPVNGNPCNKCQICRGILDGSLMDVVEMDAASNNSVDNIRRICDEVVFMPSLAKYKVYIVDEVHMLSTGAFNALLKTLEEPPAHAVFILATTEPHRLPATILSRCQRYDFRRLPLEGIKERLKEIAQADSIELSEQALEAIATFADGAMRDAISLLDQARASIPGRIERDDVLALAGITRDDFMLEMASAILAGKVDIVLSSIDELVMSGKDLSRFLSDLAQFYRNLIVCQVSERPSLLIQSTDAAILTMKKLAAQVNYQLLIKLIQKLSELVSELRWSSDARTALEVGLIRIMSEQDKITIQEPSKLIPDEANQSEIDIQKPDQQSVKEADQKEIISQEPVKQTPEEVESPLSEADEVPFPGEEEVPYAAYDDNTYDSSDDLSQQSSSSERQTELLPNKQTEHQVKPDADLNADTKRPPAASEAAATAPVNIKPDFVSEPDYVSGQASGPDNRQPVDQDAEKIIDDPVKLWQGVLDQLQKNGEMILYLFGKTASVNLCKNDFHVVFANKDQVYFDEYNKAATKQSIIRILQDLSGCELNLAIRIAGDAEKAAAESCATAEEPWISKIRQAADQFGIPVKMEE